MFSKDSIIKICVGIMAFTLLFIGTDGFANLLGGGGGSGCVNAQFVTLATTTDCANERVLTGTVNQIVVTDNGAGSTVVLSTPQDINTTSDVTFDDLTLTGLITGATIDGDDNTLLDIGADSLDFVDSPADEECVTIEGTTQFESQPCSSGGLTLNVDLPVPSGSTTANTAYQGVPGITFFSSGAEFLTANDIYAEPFQAVDAITINRVSSEVANAGNPNDSCRVGLYEADAQWQLGALVADWGTFASDSTGWKHITVSTSISAGSYIKVILCDSAMALTFHNSATFAAHSIINTGTTSSTRFTARRRVSSPTAGQHAGGFADPGDDWDTIDLINIGGNQHALIMRWS